MLLSIHSSIYPAIHHSPIPPLSTLWSVYLSTCPSIYPRILPSICLYIYLSNQPPTHPPFMFSFPGSLPVYVCMHHSLRDYYWPQLSGRHSSKNSWYNSSRNGWKSLSPWSSPSTAYIPSLQLSNTLCQHFSISLHWARAEDITDESDTSLLRSHDLVTINH